MQIGEISAKTGLSRDTIRFYEKRGLIKTTKHISGNNYRNYTEDTLQRLFAIMHIKSFGFTLNETAEWLELIGQNQASCQTVSQQVHHKMADIDRKVTELLALKNSLRRMVTDCCQSESPSDNCPSITVAPITGAVT